MFLDMMKKIWQNSIYISVGDNNRTLAAAEYDSRAFSRFHGLISG
jgi:hypothetical protein